MKNICLRITEECITDLNKEGIRTYFYETEETNTEEAIIKFLKHFDSDNVYDCNDDFEEGCLSSKIVKIEIL